MSQPESLAINSVARNAVWVYDTYSPPRFGGAPAIVERVRNYQMPDFGKLPESAYVAVELYGGAVTLRLDGATRRIYTRRFDYISYRTKGRAPVWRSNCLRGAGRVCTRSTAGSTRGSRRVCP